MLTGITPRDLFLIARVVTSLAAVVCKLLDCLLRLAWMLGLGQLMSRAGGSSVPADGLGLPGRFDINFIAVSIKLNLRVAALDANDFQALAQVLGPEMRARHWALVLLVIVVVEDALVIVQIDNVAHALGCSVVSLGFERDRSPTFLRK